MISTCLGIQDMWKKRHNNSKAGINNRSGRATHLPILTLKNSPPLENWVHFLNVFLFLAGPVGSGQKTSYYRPNELMAKNEDHAPFILYLPLLVIDYY
jgi:hypothetical protein